MPDRRTVHLYPESIAVDRREPTWGPDATREADVAHCRANCRCTIEGPGDVSPPPAQNQPL